MAKPANKPAPASPSKSGAVTTTKQNLPAVQDEEFAGMPTGLENVTARDLVIPRITILQALSPQLQKKKPEYIQGAEAGDFCDTATNEIYKESFDLVPCYYATIYLQWAPRDSGKGLVANHGIDGSILKQCKPDDDRRMVLPNGDYVAETATYYILNLNAGGRRSFIPMTSTQLKAARKWMTLITNQRLKRNDGTEFMPPIYYRSWKASAIEQSNAQGDWFGWRFDPGEPVLAVDPSRALLEEAKAFSAQCKEGLVKGDFASMAAEAAAESSGADNENKQM